MTILKETARDFVQDEALTLAAALAYYAIFSLAPLLVIAIGVAGLVLSEDAAQQQITAQLKAVLGDRATAVIQSMMASQTREGSWLATIIGGIALLLGATGMFGQLKSSLNRIWQVRPKAGRGILGLLLDRLVSVLLVLAIGILLLLSIILTTLMSAFYDQLASLLPLPPYLAQALQLLLTLVVMTALFALIFKVLPDVKIRWRSVLMGSFVTALLFLVGEVLLGLYLGRQGTSSPFGAAGSVVLVLMWIYYSALILFAGAEFTRVYAQETGSPIQPRRYAEPAT